MRYLVTSILLLAMAGLPAQAAKKDLRTGGTCRGVDCADFDRGQSRASGSSTSSNGSAANNPPHESHGAYRIPYENETKVYVSQDSETHSPPGKADLIGGGIPGVVLPGVPRVVAAAPGEIMKIEDSRKKSQSPTADDCMNNFVWIKHDNGEWTKYSHMKQDSTREKAGLSEGDTVRGGTYLGDQGSVGCSNPPHLHFEVTFPSSSSPSIDSGSGAIRGEHRTPVMCGLKDGDTTFQRGKTYEASAGPGEVLPGEAEVVRHGMPFHNYRCFLKRASNAGYRPVWIDFFTIDNDLHVNVVVRPGTISWISRSGMDSGGFKQNNQEFKSQGYRVTQLESYVERGDVRYAALWEKRSGPAPYAYWGFSSEAHQGEVDELKGKGFRPVSISVVSQSSELKYSAVWEKASGGWWLRSSMTVQEYRDTAREKRGQGLEVVRLNAYVHKKEPYLSAIWHSGVDGTVRRRTDLGAKDFDREWSTARDLDLVTVALAAYEVDGPAKYTAVFGE